MPLSEPMLKMNAFWSVLMAKVPDDSSDGRVSDEDKTSRRRGVRREVNIGQGEGVRIEVGDRQTQGMDKRFLGRKYQC